MSGNAGIKYRNYGLDIARCAAVGFVFFSHSLLNLYSSKIPYIWYWVLIGVELFFALSGFLIGRMLIEIFERNQDNLFKHIWNFWIRRWFRTLPLYFILFCIYLFVYNKWIYPVNFDYRYLFFLQNFSGPPPNFFGESWSLGIEEWFYFGFPILLFIACLLKKRVASSYNIFKVFIPVVILTIGIQIIIRLFYPGCTSWGCVSVLLRFDSAAYGLLGAAFVSKQKQHLKRPQSVYFLVAGFILCIAAAIIEFSFFYHPYIPQLYFPVNGVGTTLIIIGLYYHHFPKKYTTIPFLSKISYSIYLIHLSGVIVPLQVFTKSSALEKTLLLWLISLILTIVISSLTYQLIEKPFLKIRERWFPASYKK